MIRQLSSYSCSWPSSFLKGYNNYNIFLDLEHLYSWMHLENVFNWNPLIYGNAKSSVSKLYWISLFNSPWDILDRCCFRKIKLKAAMTFPLTRSILWLYICMGPTLKCAKFIYNMYQMYLIETVISCSTIKRSWMLHRRTGHLRHSFLWKDKWIHGSWNLTNYRPVSNSKGQPEFFSSQSCHYLTCTSSDNDHEW